MNQSPTVSFAKTPSSGAGTLVVLTDGGLGLADAAASLGIGDVFARAASAADFKGRQFAVLDILAPISGVYDRWLAIGLGKASELLPVDWSRLGGTLMGALHKGETATVLLDRADGVSVTPEEAAEFAFGATLRAYDFDRYKSKKADVEAKSAPILTIVTAEPGKARKAWASRSAIAEGVILARDLVHEPSNVLGTVELAEKAEALESLGLTIETLGEKQMKKLGMRALLGVAQGSVRPPRVVVMQWNGGKSKDAPIALVGKGVVFDSGGVSIKPAGGMEDMKGDMGGAAAVIGTMHALASRKAKANVIGIIGIVENMADGNAQRPGDIVAAASGTTIEIINTDAEGRLVLADVLWYVQKTYAPKAIVDLATLTGAIIVALGRDHAGLFSNDDALADALSKAGEAVGEKVWRLPLGKAYDKLIESKFADIKNTGGREAGSITAAQFIGRFINEGVAWAHLDVAGTAIGSVQTETNRSWASGWGVRILDRLIADNYEG